MRLLVLGAVLMIALQGSAQKYAHVNIGNVMSEMPEVAEADSLLIMYRNTLQDSMQIKGAAFEAKYQKYVQDVNSGLITRTQAVEREQVLAAEEQVLQEYAQLAEQRLATRRQELMMPVLDRIQKVIDEIGASGDYQMIFDASIIGAVMFADESKDLSEVVLQKLQQ